MVSSLAAFFFFFNLFNYEIYVWKYVKQEDSSQSEQLYYHQACQEIEIRVINYQFHSAYVEGSNQYSKIR